MKTLYLILIFSILTIQGQAQILPEHIATKRLPEYARVAEAKGDIYGAISYLNEYTKRKPTDLQYLYKLSVKYCEIGNFKKAKPGMARVVQYGGKKFQEASYYYGQIHKALNNYDSALYYLKKYKKSLPENNRTRTQRYQADIALKACELAAEEFSKKNDLEVNRLRGTVNRAHAELTPFLFNDTTLIYASIRSDSQIVIRNNEKVPVRQYHAAILQNELWTDGYEAPAPFTNISEMQMSGGAFSPDGNRFYFAAGMPDLNGNMHDALYVAYKNAKTWQTPIRLNDNINLSGFSSSFPAVVSCIVEGYDILYFVSDRPGGRGGKDLWYAVFDKNADAYKPVVNCGGYINSPGDEVSPFFDKSSDLLYFSSNGYPSIGGFDVYRTHGATVYWTLPENLGTPINSKFDDYCYAEFLSQKFIVSNRPDDPDELDAGCCFDIFDIKKIQVEQPLFVTGTVRVPEKNFWTKYTDKPEIAARTIVSLYEKTDSTEIFVSSDTILPPNNFTFATEKNKNYTLKFTKENHLPEEITFNTDTAVVQDILLQNIEIEQVSTKPLVFRNIYFEYDDYRLTAESEQIIDTTILLIMQHYPKLIVEISAHTDYKGTDSYNKKLSQKHAQSVVNYLISKGIRAERLLAEGCGESKPIVNALNPDGSDNPEARAKNRRIEFLVIGQLF